ncbi:MAG: amino acid ABC transporter substrate-binding protein [Gammaproteobacteria bacterium]|nr:amino acid ABC transporter substrate-binding protein [Gammaproteobacteria bacterium]NIR85021.1 amino acid ABC transporter substrate-binding protein [Gammaproteobacteria bacterium]NIR88288.1 amino acid ABC transporter substrate-binding protein [Gammaproteobacteria bacterium]NIU06068.1 amino acid ABC transporter substrate-binding protein [Gammaproteobacteria bacterium]NIV73487.1 transporter substrate-binding domain-containing protein [Gammaproteobacteria bacterium]
MKQRPHKTLRRTLMASLMGALIGVLPGWAAAAGDLELIEPGKLHVAFNGDMPGTGLDENGNLKGLDGEIMSWVADQLGLEVVPHLMEWASEIESVKAGRVDVMHGMMAWTASREKVLSITDPIYHVSPVITQPKDRNWNTVEDLEGKTFGTITGFALIPDLKRIPGLSLKLYDTTDAAIRDLMAGRVQAIFADPPLIHWAIQQNPDWPIHYSPIAKYNPDYPVFTRRYGVVFALNRQAKNLTAAFNEQIRKAWATCKNWDIAKNYGMASEAWFTPAESTTRPGIDRPADWQLPRLPASCM